jgi:hypothetical protein
MTTTGIGWSSSNACRSGGPSFHVTFVAVSRLWNIRSQSHPRKVSTSEHTSVASKMATRADFGRGGHAKPDQDRSSAGFTWQSRSHRADSGNSEIIRGNLHRCDRALFTDARHEIDRQCAGRTPSTARARCAVGDSRRARAPHCGGCSHRSQAHHLPRLLK